MPAPADGVQATYLLLCYSSASGAHSASDRMHYRVDDHDAIPVDGNVS